MRRATALALLVLLAALAGCVGQETADPVAAQNTTIPETAPPPEPAQEGDIVGAVTDLSQVPVPGAEVFLLRNQDLGTVAAQDGTYTLEDVPAGEHLIRAEAEGMRGETFLIKVKSGQTTLLDISLEHLPSEEPFHETRELAGLIGCSFTVGQGHDNHQDLPCIRVDPNARTVFNLEPGPQPERILLELVWEANTEMAEALSMDAQTIGTGVQDVTLGEAHGSSVLRLDIPAEKLERHFIEPGKKYRVNVSATPHMGDDHAAMVGGAIEQEFTLLVTTFYFDPGDPSFSALE
ncbi:MAG: carboxypeptidase-like regulatory domain-containing protein [Candidatus Thermoplasmatota archaeon]|nr:carboxypeptidase-like regulatory domain-containing protein [Candidatus Thermoplasmatota archaeon]